MYDPSTLGRQQAVAMIAALAATTPAADPQARLEVEIARAVERRLPRSRPAANRPIRAATPCPARHRTRPDAAPANTPRAKPAINPMFLGPDAAPKNTPLAEPALTPCPAAAAAGQAPPVPPNPGINPMSRENGASPLAIPPGTDFPTRRRRPYVPCTVAVAPR